MRYTAKAFAASLTTISALALQPLSAQEREWSIYEPCSKIPEDAERLKCFDRTFARENAIIAEQKEAERRREAENFGLTPSQIREREENAASSSSGDRRAIAQAADDDADDGEVTTTIDEVLTDARGDYVMLMANGQIWRSTSNKSFRGRIRAGWSVTISQIWSGGYRLKIKDKRGFLGVKRIR